VTEIEARYYDGRSSRALPVRLRLFADGEACIEGEGLALRRLAGELTISERIGSAPRWIELGGDARCEVADADALEAWLAGQRRGRGGLVAALERHWTAALVVGFAGAALLAAVVVWGVPALAGFVARSIPTSVDERLGESGLETLDGTLFAPSELPAEARREVEHLFARLRARAEVRPEPRLEFRSGGQLGANAFALPSGIVVVTDELVALAPGAEEIAAVLAHEIGHVHHRHGLRSVLQSAGVSVLIAGALGDFVSVSALAGTLPVLLVELRYSRRFEEEADAYGIEALRGLGIDPRALARLLERLSQAHGGDGPLPAYLSTHPSTAERVEAIRRAAGSAAP
jgi:Zn-dependent protease with chaperone function